MIKTIAGSFADGFVLRGTKRSVAFRAISMTELKAAMDTAGDRYRVETLRLMMKIFDTDRSGNIDFDVSVSTFCICSFHVCCSCIGTAHPI